MATPAGWVSVPAAARKLALSERRVWGLVSEGTLDSMLIGGRRLVNPEAVATREKKHGDSEMFQSQLQSESLYTRIVRLEKQVEFLQKELKNGR